jgi:hypothetical protein
MLDRIKLVANLRGKRQFASYRRREYQHSVDSPKTKKAVFFSAQASTGTDKITLLLILT